jgi:single-strand DNA-binding protein
MNGTINKVILIGHLGDNVKMHYFDGGNSIGRFPLATNESFVNKQTGERVTNTEWHNIVVRNKLAEIFEKHVKKGDKVYLEGRLRTRKWTNDQGIERYTTEIHVTEFTFLSPKKDNPAHQAVSQQAEDKGEESKPADNPATDVPEDDLPF